MSSANLSISTKAKLIVPLLPPVVHAPLTVTCRLPTKDCLLQQMLQQRTTLPPLQIKTLAILAAAAQHITFRQFCHH